MKNYIGNGLQIRGAEKYILQDGKGDGMHFLNVRNGLGLEVWISLDRAGDVSRATFKGDNMSYFSPCGYVSPKYYDGVGAGFLKSFTAGLFTTCGLTAVGSPCTDDGEDLPLHGNISNIPAELCGIEENENELTVKLKVRDTVIFGRKLVLCRTYKFSYIDNSFEVIDTVTNEAQVASPYMILYHCNFGYPLLCEDCIVKVPNNSFVARNSHAEKFIDTALRMEKPQADFEECCYYFDVKENNGTAKAGIYNEKIDKGVVLSYNKSALSCFTEWKMMGKTEYVLGLEPGNCTPDGRNVLRKNGTLEFIDSGESKTTSVKFSFVDDIKSFEGEF
jgi:hypothetical protein